ncbi:MAG: hypothetical protein ACRD1K_20780 [Acidimicrobiales bacterium]
MPVPFHAGQEAAWASERRWVALVAGTKGGKTSFDPWWLWREITLRGAGDYLAITATYDLFKFKLLPALRQAFEEILGIGRWWAASRMMELRDPRTGEFMARHADDLMWGRIIMRSAEAAEGLESGDAKAAICDEAGLYALDTWRAIKRRLALAQGRALLTTTLYDIAWLDTEIMQKAAKNGRTQIIQQNNGEIEVTDNAEADITLVQFDSIVNPVYPRAEFDSAKRDLPDDEFQAFHRGRRVAMRTLIYDAFVQKPKTCKRFKIPPNWRRWVGHDFGGVNMVAVFYAEKPGANALYCYRIYEQPNTPIPQHADNLLEGEPGIPFRAIGGSSSEQQWRDEFATAGWPIDEPEIGELWLGINRVYAAHRQGLITYFEDLEDILADKQKYRRKKDRQGNVINEIENKPAFHRMDAERYIVSEFMAGRAADWENVEGLGHLDEFESRWA